MKKNAIREVKFKATIINGLNNKIENKSTVVYSFYNNEQEKEVTKTKESNVVKVYVEVAELVCKKKANVKTASLNDIIKYQAIIKNTGTLKTTNVFYFDELPSMLSLVNGSVKVNGTTVNNADLSEGVFIGELEEEDFAVVTYEAKVIAGSCTGVAINKAYVEYIYIYGPKGGSGSKTSDLCCASVNINISAFKQIMLNKKLCLPCSNPSIEDVDNVVAEVKIDNSYVIKTTKGISYENQRLTNGKLIIHGTVDVSLLYTGLKEDQQLHSVREEYPFSSFIVLPMNYDNENIEISAIIEDTTLNQLDDRCVEVGVVVLLVSKFK